MKQRIIEYDYIRIVAMLLVVACHCFGDTTDASPSLISLLSYLEMPCNGLFFAVSGALLLPVKADPSESVSFLRKRLSKVVIPTIIWSFIYMLLGGTFTVANVIGLPFSPKGASIFWFMYVMIGLYIIAPVISPWLDKVDNRTLRTYLAFWGISLCYPILSNWIDVNTSEVTVLYYLSGYVGFFILGYYLKRIGGGILLMSALCYLGAFAIMVLVKILCPYIKLYNGLWYLTIFCAISVWFYWNLIVQISKKVVFSERTQLVVAIMSNLIFGIYFIHYGIIEYVIPKITMFDTLPYVVRYTSHILIAYGGALLLSFLISYLPGANYIIGYSRRK